MEVIFKTDWMEISKTAGSYKIQYNSGDMINSIKEIEVSEEDAVLAQKNDQEAYNVIIKYQNIEMGLI